MHSHKELWFDRISTVEILCRNIDTSVRPLKTFNKQHMGGNLKPVVSLKYMQQNHANNIFSGWYKIGFEIKNEIERQGQSNPKLSGILRGLRCIIGPNLEILSWIDGDWWHGQAQNMAIFYFEVKFDLEVQGQLTPKTIGILTKVFCSSGPNLVILAWTGDKLSRGQASDYRTHRRTHRQTQATTIPEGQNWPRVKMDTCAKISLSNQLPTKK